MKKTIFILASIILSGVAFEGCQKKGPNDPSISLHGRKGRVDGDWTVTKYAESSAGSSENYDGTTWLSTAGGTTSKSTVTWTISMDKKGTYTADKTETATETMGSITTTTVTHNVSSGTWNFTGGVGDKKNRSQLLMYEESNTETITTTTTGMPTTTSVTPTSATGFYAFSMIYDIDQLKNKEMILTWLGTSMGASTSGSMTLSQ